MTEKDVQLINALNGGKRWAVADVRHCDPLERKKLTEALRSAFPRFKCKFAFFENNVALCENNVFVREGPAPRHQLNLIYYYTNVYDIPSGAKLLKVYDAKAQGGLAVTS